MEERGNERRDDAWRNGLTKHWTFEGFIYFDFIANCFIRNFKTSRIKKILHEFRIILSVLEDT